MKENIEFEIPKGYKLSDKSTNEKIVLEYVANKDEARQFLIGIFNKMKVIADSEEKDSVLYEIDGKIVFQQDFKNSTLWVSYIRIWDILEERFDMRYYETQSFIKNTIEEVLKWNGLTPQPYWGFDDLAIEEVLKWNGLTPGLQPNYT